MSDFALGWLTLPQVLEHLRCFFEDVPAQNWYEKTALFASMLENVRAEELEAVRRARGSQPKSEERTVHAPHIMDQVS